MSTGWTGSRIREVLEDVYDSTSKSLRTTAGVGPSSNSVVIKDINNVIATITEIGAKNAIDVNVADITLDQTNDSVALGDGTALFTSTVTGPKRGLDVNLMNTPTFSGNITVAPSGETITLFDAYAGLASGVDVDVLTLTEPPTPPYHYLQRIYLSSTQVGTFEIRKNGDIIYRVRFSPTQFTYTIDLATASAFGVKLIAGDVITINAKNNSNNVGDFDATLQMMETL